MLFQQVYSKLFAGAVVGYGKLDNLFHGRLALKGEGGIAVYNVGHLPAQPGQRPAQKIGAGRAVALCGAGLRRWEPVGNGDKEASKDEGMSRVVQDHEPSSVFDKRIGHLEPDAGDARPLALVEDDVFNSAHCFLR